jgi:anti-sigma B factor antagonist
MDNHLEIQTHPGARPQQRILSLRGPLQLESVPEFLRVARAEVAPVVILDLSAVPYVDSTGVGALMQIFVHLRREQRQLGLAAPNPRVLAALEITHVQSLFPVFPNVAEAERRLS